jgi:hypothetical protein
MPRMPKFRLGKDPAGSDMKVIREYNLKNPYTKRRTDSRIRGLIGKFGIITHNLDPRKLYIKRNKK